MLCQSSKVLCRSVGKQKNTWVLMQWACLVGHVTKGTLYKSHALPFSIIFVSTVMQVEQRKEETDMYKALCIALLDKYYGHQRYQICFAHEELRHQNDDIRSRNHFNLVDSFTREEIEVEFILNCLLSHRYRRPLMPLI